MAEASSAAADASLSNSRGRGRSGFTLIEMLAVIVIVTLLVALLLPALARSRRAAQAAVCGSNQRQVHTAFYNYLVGEKSLPKLTAQLDARPPFESNADLFVPYYLSPAIWHANASGSQFVNFGKLWEQHLLDSPQAFFCPTQTHPEFQFATPVNAWPPDPVGAPQTGLAFHLWNDVFSSYTRRLGLSWLHFDKVHPGTAITADVNMFPDYARTNHDGKGFNVTTADGAVSYVSDPWFTDESQVGAVGNFADAARRCLAAFRRLDRAGVPDEWWK